MNTDIDQTFLKLRTDEDNFDSEALVRNDTDYQTPIDGVHDAAIRAEFHGNDTTAFCDDAIRAEFHGNYATAFCDDAIRAELHDNGTTAEFPGLDINLHPDRAVVGGLNGDEVERLTLRVRELENIVGNQNRELLRRETLKRNYRACLEELARYKTECSVLEKDRDTQSNEKSFYQLQAGELTVENNKLRDRIQEKNSLLLETERIKVQQTSEINELKEQLKSLAERFADGAISRQETGSLREVVRRRENQFGSDTIKGSLNFGPYTSRVLQQSDQSVHIMSKVVVTYASSNSSSNRSEPSPHKRRFRTSQSDHPVCKNCRTVFCDLKPLDVQCTFHIAPPQPYEVWRSNLVDPIHSAVPKGGKSYKFWPCCEQVSINEPPGCRRLRKHELIQ